MHGIAYILTHQVYQLLSYNLNYSWQHVCYNETAQKVNQHASIRGVKVLHSPCLPASQFTILQTKLGDITGS